MINKTTYQSKSAEETKKIAADIAKKFKKNGGVLALSGELGAGKTTFTQGFAESLGIKDRIISPTFVLIRQHHLPESERILFHIDLYRLEGKIDTKEIGLNEMLDSANENIILIEWPEKITELETLVSGKNFYRVEITKKRGDERLVSVFTNP